MRVSDGLEAQEYVQGIVYPLPFPRFTRSPGVFRFFHLCGFV